MPFWGECFREMGHYLLEIIDDHLTDQIMKRGVLWLHPANFVHFTSFGVCSNLVALTLISARRDPGYSPARDVARHPRPCA